MAMAGQAPFDGYEAYYSTLESTLFKLHTAVQLEPYAVPGTETLGFAGAGETAGRKHRVEVRPGVLSVDGRRVRFKATHAFPGEAANREDLGRGTTAYFAAGWACVAVVAVLHLVDGQDVPAGVSFREYAIKANNAFAPTGALREANFVEPANVYKFSVD
ncbi:hypothetical protein [Variovorax sp. OV329]|uniref:hypothetical protein n=1 Tax=Variovorax sp. OV329 TaxID=1882825 RepID=UPI0008DF89FA|nr:hypothetical protein [Variovorax sp. OV329]SFN36808.1 hypothetical protein SAMN05444747_12337 [Variovorax sp. OV329]